MKHAKHSRPSHISKVGVTLFTLIFLCVLVGVGIVYFHPSSSNSSQKNMSNEKTSSSTSESSKSDLPNVSTADWNLLLINRNHLQEENTPALTQIDDVQVDSRIAENTRQFLEEARTIVPEEVLISGYRSKAEQTELYNQSLADLQAAGYSPEEAESLTQKQVQIPGASEHQTGLAIDMSAPEGQTDEVAAKIAEIAPKYGFILRYVEGKQDITGVDFENWHYRYVGVENAQYIYQHNLVLEEYIDLLKADGK